MATTNQCSSQAIQSFPVQLANITPTIDNYTSVLDPISLEFQWGMRTTAPQFINIEGLVDEPTTTTLRYLGSTYTIESVGFTSPTHNQWIVPSLVKNQNVEDIVLTFSTANLMVGVPQYIIVVIPVLRSQSALGDPAYLTGFGGSGAINQVSIQSIIPSNKSEPFAYYTTCCPGSGSSDPPQNILVVVSVKGLYVSASTMSQISSIYAAISVNPNYGEYVPPLGISFSKNPYIIGSSQQFTTTVKVTQELIPVSGGATGTVSPAGTVSATGATGAQTSTDAYKCVTLDPDTQIQNGQLNIDPATGKLLSTIDAERQMVKDDIFSNKAQIPAEVFTKYVSTILGLFFALIIIGIIFYFFIGAAVGTSAVGGGGFFQRFFNRLADVPAYATIGMLAGFVGFMIGMIIKHN
jgi:hypothetical protein